MQESRATTVEHAIAQPDSMEEPFPCWSCKGPVATGHPFCGTCGAVQPPGQVDHFTRLGLDAVFTVEQRDLDRAYFNLQRQLHPDRFATRSPREKSLSQQQATALNDAYETLKVPLARADYLVHLKGMGVLPEGCNLVNDQMLLMESMELREALAETETPSDVDAITERANDDISACVGQLAILFAEDDIEGACRLTTRLKYLKKLAEECRARKIKLGL